MPKIPLFFLGLLALCSHHVHAVTVYGQQGMTIPSGLASTDSSAATATAAALDWLSDLEAYNTVTLTAPTLPTPVPSAFGITVQNSGASVSGMGVQQKGDFFGFSIEMSVVQQVIGKNSTFLQVPFLNLLAAVADRAGSVRVRVGGNTQEYATLVASLPNYEIIAKDKSTSTNPTDTPTLDFTAEMLYMLANVSALVNTRWYLGIPFNDTTNLRLEIAEAAEAILGDNVLAFQVGNEPDLYVAHGHRNSTYSQYDYFGEFGVVVEAMANDAKIPTKGRLVAPSIQGTWTLQEVYDTGFITSYNDELSIVSVEQYPDNNCAAAFPDAGFGDPVNPQDVLPNYLTHTAPQNLIAQYLSSIPTATDNGKEFMMFETNTASCGGFPGVSDAFASALWGVDYGLQMAYSNFTGALFHVGGQDVSYNPFTPPPTNISSFKEWTVGPIFYSSIVMAEALGPSNTSQVLDLFANSANNATPAYAIYENGALARMVLINYMTEQDGQGSYTASISLGDGTVPSSVKVKYLTAPSVVEKNNITWAGQTFGGRFECDGRLSGTENVQTVTCDTGANTCAITVPAPGVALVFVSDTAQASEDPTTQTFSTTAVTKTANTVTIDPSVLATSNGMSGKNRAEEGSTSQGSSGAGRAAGVVPGMAMVGAFVIGAWAVVAGVRR